MSDPVNDSDDLLSSLMAGETTPPVEDAAVAADEDVDAIIDELETLASGGRRRLLGRKLMVDEAQLLAIVDRLRASVPAEVRQAHRVLDEHDRIIAAAEAQAKRLIDERGLLDSVEAERERILVDATREAEQTRAEADQYARNVLQDLQSRLDVITTSVRNGIATLTSEPEDAAEV